MKIHKNKFVLSILTLTFSLSTIVPVSAASIPHTDVSNIDLASKEVEYISVSDYFQKYGEETVNQGFNTVENALEREAGITNSLNSVEQSNTDNEEMSDLFLSLKEGKFLGQNIISVSDVSPYDRSFSLKIENNMPSQKMVSDTEISPNSLLTSSSNKKKSYTNYDVYYSDNQPQNSTDLQNGAYEPLAGSYFYKYAYAFEKNYLCSVDVQFSNTQIKCGNQDNCVYTYVAAGSSSQTLDFGLMACASATSRNKGMYAFYNNGSGQLNVEAYPKVMATSYGNNMMTLENKTVTIRLSVGDASKPGEVEMYMESGGSCIYYNIVNDSYTSSLVSGNANKALTFLEGVSCVEANGNNTSLTSGSYYKNIKLKNSKLYSFNSSAAKSFGVYGPNTYYTFVCKPSKLSLTYGSTYENISINYN